MSSATSSAVSSAAYPASAAPATAAAIAATPAAVPAAVPIAAVAVPTPRAALAPISGTGCACSGGRFRGLCCVSGVATDEERSPTDRRNALKPEPRPAEYRSMSTHLARAIAVAAYFREHGVMPPWA